MTKELDELDEFELEAMRDEYRSGGYRLAADFAYFADGVGQAVWPVGSSPPFEVAVRVTSPGMWAPAPPPWTRPGDGAALDWAPSGRCVRGVVTVSEAADGTPVGSLRFGPHDNLPGWAAELFHPSLLVAAVDDGGAGDRPVRVSEVAA